MALSRDQSNYLFQVMRQRPGDAVRLFNGLDGEWRAEIVEAARRGGSLVCRERLRPQAPLPEVWLIFAPLKKARTDFLVEKASELGCARLVPVFTRQTNAERVNRARLQAHAVEAAEQCGALAVPQVAEPQPLGDLIEGWDPARRLLFCDLAPGAPPALSALTAPDGPWAVLAGPEGGFTADESAHLAALDFVRPVRLGPRTLRAETAALAALALWQATLGDWR